MLILKLGEDGEEKLIGHKAYNLNKAMTLSNAVVPSGIVVTTELYDVLLDRAGLNENLLHQLIKQDKLNVIRRKIINANLPKEFVDEIYKNIKAVDAPYVVRSSSTFEDLNQSFAGMYDSFINVRIDDVIDKIKMVMASQFNERAKSYFSFFKSNNEMPKMAVIIQNMIANAKYGVSFCFSVNKEDKYIIESNVSDPTLVTSGKGKNDIFYITNNNIIKNTRFLGISSLFDYEIDRIVSMAKELKKIVFPLDIEFAVKRNQVFLLQLRKMTKDVPIHNARNKFGIPAAEGKAKGIVKLLKPGFDRDLKLTKKDIIVAPEIWVEEIDAIKNAGGICLEVPSILSHAAIIAREYSIPCVVGAYNICDQVLDGERIEINGSTGEIKLLDQKDVKLSFKPDEINLEIMNLQPYWFDKHFVLLYELDNKIILFSILKDRDPNLLVHLVDKLSEFKPVIDGEIDTWYSYALVFEMSHLKQGLKMELEKAENIASNSQKDKIIEYKKMLEAKAQKNYSTALKEYNNFTKSKNKDLLYKSFIHVEEASAYINIIKLLSSSFIKERIKRDELSYKFALDIQQDKNILFIRDKIYSLIDNIISIGKQLGVDKKDYTSNLAYIKELLTKQ
ncbi:MAG: PEP/pyruvate-binding domain-containing protein [Candidatus Micrarchaeia archaeon]